MVIGFPDDRDEEEKAREADHRARDEDAARQDGLSAQAEADQAAKEQEEADLLALLHNKSVAIVNISPETDKKVLELYQEGLELLRLATERVIKSDADAETAVDDLSVIQGYRKKLEALKKEYEAPITQHLSNFRAVFSKFIDPFLGAERINKEKWGAYRKAVEEAARKAEETNRMAEEVARRQAEASGTGEIKVDLKPVEVPKTADTLRSNIGTGSAYKTPKYRIIDFKALPDEYKLPDAGKLTRVIKAAKGQIQIPGVEITFEDVLSIRSKG